MVGISFGPLHIEVSTIRVEVHYYYHADQPTNEALTKLVESNKVIERRVRDLWAQNMREEEAMSVQLDALRAEVERNRSVDESAKVLIQGIVTRLQAMDADQASIDALVTDLRGSSDSLATAVAANTPAETTTADTAQPPTGGGGGTGEPAAPPPGGEVSGAGGATGPTETGAPGGTTEPTSPGGGVFEPGGTSGAPAGGTGEPGTAGEGTPPTP